MFPNNKFIMVMRNCMVFMTTRYAFLKKEDVFTKKKPHISAATNPRILNLVSN